MVLAATGLFSFATLCFIAAFFLLSAWIHRQTKFSTLLVFGCVALTSAVRFMGSTVPVSETEVNRLLAQLPLKNVQCVGTIAQTPDYYTNRSGTGGVWVFSLNCEGMKLTEDWTQRRGKIQVRLFGIAENQQFRKGERIQLTGDLSQRDYPGSEAVELKVSESDSWKILTFSFWNGPVIAGQHLRERASEVLSAGIRDKPAQLGVFRALLLGYRKAIPSEIYDHFRQTGTLHIFAISGLHVGIVGLLIVIVLKALGVPRNWWGVWLLPLLLFYVCSTGMKSSALRAWTMAAVYFLAPLFRRKPDVPNAVAFAAILLLWFNPADILSAGFIFSFCVVSFLVMVFSILPRNIISGGNGLLRPVRAYGNSLVITSMTAFIASVPLAALFFGSFSPVSLVGNLIVVPLTFCIVLCGWLSIVLPIASEVFNHAAVVFVNGLLSAVSTFAEWPGAYWYVPPPSLLAILFWYVGWIAIFTHARTKQERSYLLILVGFAVVLAMT
jgi:ComEC/Rec2-related protein